LLCCRDRKEIERAKERTGRLDSWEGNRVRERHRRVTRLSKKGMREGREKRDS
jgi:hypothetical protein